MVFDFSVKLRFPIYHRFLRNRRNRKYGKIFDMLYTYVERAIYPKIEIKSTFK